MHIKSGRSQSDRNSPLNCLNANLRKASRVILSLYMEELRESGLQGTQFTLLTVLSGMGPAQIGDIAQFMSMDQTTVTRNVNLLKKGGYVDAVRGEEDRRTRIVRLTDQGREAVQAAYPLWQKAQTKIWDKLGEEKALQLLEITQMVASLAEEG
ncbi:MAG: MarR family winged helix-turn-helix transcriptional regulator [Chloroflexota bacterium]